MIDITGVRIDLLSVSGGPGKWVLIGAWVEPAGADGMRLAWRFECTTRRDAKPRVRLLGKSRIPASAWGGRTESR